MEDTVLNPICRICGSAKVNKFHLAFELGDKIGLQHIIARDGSLDKLIRPCECRGEFAHAHRVCLENWIETTRHDHCDICSYKYNVRFHERTFFDWIFETHQVSKSLKLLAAALIVYYLSAIGILVCQNRYRRNVLDIVVLSTSYFWLISCTLAGVWYCYSNIREFITWKATNRFVVVDENKDPQLESSPKPKDVLKSSGFNPAGKRPGYRID